MRHLDEVPSFERAKWAVDKVAARLAIITTREKEPAVGKLPDAAAAAVKLARAVTVLHGVAFLIA